MLRHPITRNGGSIVHNVVLQDLSSFPTLRIPFFEETNTTAGHGNENVSISENIGKSAIDA